MKKLSLTMIVKNESENLKRCLDSVKLIVDEMIVVDTGSIDHTKEIALGYGAKVYDFVWNNNFSDARNYALKQSTGDWNLVLDADEYIINDCANEIRDFMESNRGIGRIRRMDKFQHGGELRESQVFISRLLPSGINYSGRIHEQVNSDLPSINTAIDVYHDGYFLKNKSDRNLEILHLAVKECDNDAYLLFQLAKEYRMAEKHRIADGYFAQCYSFISVGDGFRPLVVVDYLYNIIANQNLELGLDIILKEENNLSDYPDFYFVCGLFYMELVFSNMEKYMSYFPYIERSYLKCLELGETRRYDSVKGTGSFRAAYNLGIYYETTGDIAKAIKYYELSAKENYKLAIERLAKL
ncbi:glycosyltransferase family 2 protein [Paenibacillus prosopidis]|uniref:Glycosyltransferase involved in cell wall biosynthesis n=1 Tax=Paenibacillus prosopidis TaxID=630520 RepID=A0A368VX98_9BACL|nr:glycosyltransferase family 2 protein [Paenibacillus prosopidis]RCW44812.1 glycosyltransferase involved in cell wall biosynthesis [Paenibacillus prosopidis]